MKKLLEFILKGISGEEEFDIDENIDGDRINLVVKAQPSLIGLLIGKEGKTIRSIRKIMSIKGTLDQKLINVTIAEEPQPSSV